MLESCGEPIGRRGRRRALSPVGTVFGRPHDIRHGCGCVGSAADHVDRVPEHRRAVAVPSGESLRGGARRQAIPGSPAVG